MILLDTNVISALMQREPDRAVLTWLDAQPPESIWTTAITVFEIRFGLELLPAGKRRRSLEEAFAAMLTDDFEGRIIAFDEAAALAAAEMSAQRKKIGRSLEIRDVQIAGIAIARRATVATRNVRHFNDLGARVVDPWVV